jgi:hypothetical protein
MQVAQVAVETQQLELVEMAVEAMVDITLQLLLELQTLEAVAAVVLAISLVQITQEKMVVQVL